MNDIWKYFEDCTSDLTIPDEWENVSYEFNTCPSWCFKGFRILIQHADPKERKFENSPRFYIFRANDRGNSSFSWHTHSETFSDVLKILSDEQTYHDVANGFMEKHRKESIAIALNDFNKERQKIKNYEYLSLDDWLLTYGNDLSDKDYKEGQAIVALFD